MAKPPRGIVFIHVPNCGASGFAAALRLRYMFSQASINLALSGASVAALHPNARGEDRIVADYEQRGRDLARLVRRGVRCISGQVRYDAALHAGAGDGYAFVTMLRDPVDRFLADFMFVHRDHADPSCPDLLSRFLETDEAARLGSQYLFHFAGHSQNRAGDLPRAVQTAQMALSRFALVGDCANPREFARGLRRLTGGPLPYLHRGRPAARPVQPQEDQMARITAICAPDIAIYRAMQGEMAA